METNDTLNYWTACMKAADLTEKTIRERLIFIRQLARDVDLETVTRKHLIIWMAGQNWSNSTRGSPSVGAPYVLRLDAGRRFEVGQSRLPVAEGGDQEA